MNLEQQLALDFKKYLIAKERTKKNTIQVLRADILNKSKELQRELTINEILEIIAKEIKEKKDALEDFTKAQRQDLIDQTNEEILTLQVYMPVPLTTKELEFVISNVMSELNLYQMKDMGRIIKEVKQEVGVRADGKEISQLVKEALNNE